MTSPDSPENNPANEQVGPKDQAILREIVHSALPSRQAMRKALQADSKALLQQFENLNITQTEGGVQVGYVAGDLIQKIYAGTDEQALAEALRQIIAAELTRSDVNRSRYAAILAALGIIIVLTTISVVTVVTPKPPPPPTPVPTPDWGRATLHVAVADFGELADPLDEPVASADGAWLAEQVAAELPERLGELPDLAGGAAVYRVPDGVISGASPVARQLTAANLATRLDADILIYGYLDVNQGQANASLVPEFYVSPRLTAADEVTGTNSFGTPLDLELPFQGRLENRLGWNLLFGTTIAPRFEALTQFIIGLGYSKLWGRDVSNIDKSIDHFAQALSVPGWDEGKEILYLWIGVALNDLSKLEGEDIPGFSCPVQLTELENERPTPVDCARAAFDTALEQNPDFARAHLGLGNLWLDHARQNLAGQPFYSCDYYDEAILEYKTAQELAPQASPIAYIELKTYYDLGLAYASQYRNLCPNSTGDAYTLAVDSLKQAIAAFESATSPAHSSTESQDIPTEETPEIVRRIGARAYYQLGLVYTYAQDYGAAIDTFSSAIDITGPAATTADKDWQSLRWDAYTWRGHAYSGWAESDPASWEAALNDYLTVIAGYEAHEYDDGSMISDACYHAGLAYEALGEPANALDRYVQAVDVPGADASIVSLAQERIELLSTP